MKGYVYAHEDILLSEAVGRLLARKGQTLSAAESCTGGLLSSEITKIPGSSRYFRGAVTAYHNGIKKKWLAVPRLFLAKGAVSREVAGALARAIREKMKTTYGLGITGIAGPGGGSAQKPAGLVFISLASSKKVEVWRHHFWGDRIQVQTKAVKKSLQYLWQKLMGFRGPSSR